VNDKTRRLVLRFTALFSLVIAKVVLKLLRG